MSNQDHKWYLRIFYKIEGKKESLNRRNCTIIGGLVCGVATIFLLLQPTPAPVFSASGNRKAFEENIYSQPEDVITLTPQDYSKNVDAQKSKKLQSVRYQSAQIISRPKLSQIPPGLIAKAVLVSGGSNGLVRATLTEPLLFNGEILIETGTILVGQGSSSEERLFIRFGQLVYKDGTMESINAHAADQEDKIVGLKGSLLGNRGPKMAASIGLGFVGGLAEGLQESKGEGGVEIKAPTLKNALLNGTATATLEQSREILSNMKDKTPIIEVPAGTSIYVMFAGGQ